MEAGEDTFTLVGKPYAVRRLLPTDPVQGWLPE